ncbi:MAG: methyltransferase [Bacteroidetes bacterium]|nr:methyltransferase [Bacteroidota bacterium]
MSKLFHFKQFSINHGQCAMKVGTDAVLLGAWMSCEDAKDLLEIGTGSGIIALMASQRTKNDAHIDAIEIEKGEVEQARENVLNSPWPKKIFVHHAVLQNYENKTKYDFIFSNPPYFNNSLRSPAPHRNRTRHTHQLGFDDLVFNAKRLLHPQGKLAVILPVSEGNKFKEIAAIHNLYLIRQCAFYSRAHKPQERWLLEFGLKEQRVESGKLVLYAHGNQWSEAYRTLTGEFYIE